jgi:phenylpropionate dioxygenase-like ring-hydroxylating dioxygenase large terminal subunit
MKPNELQGSGPASLVDPINGLVDRRVFTDPDLHRLELERVFARSWLFVAHESELPRPGDYVTRQMADDPVIVTRGSDGKLHVFLNACTHRGAMVCRADAGNSPSYTCPYHGWTFANTGKLLAAADDLACFKGRVDLKRYDLREARVGTYGGCVFATFDDALAPLEQYLGDARWYLDMFFKRTPGGVEVLGAPVRWRARKNWKYGAVNFAADGPHALKVHGPVTKRIIGGGLPQDFLLKVAKDGPAIRLPNGHNGIFVDIPEGLPPFLGFEPELVPLFQRTLNAGQLELLGKMFNGVFTIFPHMSWVHFPVSFSPDMMPVHFFNLRVWQPVAPGVTEIWSWFLADKEGSDAYKEASLRAGVQTFTAAGTFDQDDAEAWAAIDQGSRGTIGRREQTSFQMVVASHDERIENFPGPGEAYYSTYSEMSEFGILLEWRRRMAIE